MNETTEAQAIEETTRAQAIEETIEALESFYKAEGAEINEAQFLRRAKAELAKRGGTAQMRSGRLASIKADPRIKVICRTLRQKECEQHRPITTASPIKHLPLETTFKNALYRSNIKKVGQLKAIPHDNLQGIIAIGELGSHEIQLALEWAKPIEEAPIEEKTVFEESVFEEPMVEEPEWLLVPADRALETITKKAPAEEEVMPEGMSPEKYAALAELRQLFRFFFPEAFASVYAEETRDWLNILLAGDNEAIAAAFWKKISRQGTIHCDNIMASLRWHDLETARDYAKMLVAYLEQIAELLPTPLPLEE